MTPAIVAELAMQIEALERRLLEADTRQSVAALEMLLAEDFVEFGQSGRRYHRAAVIAELGAETAAVRELSEFDLRPLGHEVLLATYRVDRRGADGRTASSRRSSIWHYRQQRWQLVFHQGTPLPADPY